MPSLMVRVGKRSRLGGGRVNGPHVRQAREDDNKEVYLLLIVVKQVVLVCGVAFIARIEGLLRRIREVF